jgi:hypothetical protein
MMEDRLKISEIEPQKLKRITSAAPGRASVPASPISLKEVLP